MKSYVIVNVINISCIKNQIDDLTFYRRNLFEDDSRDLVLCSYIFRGMNKRGFH